MKKVLLKNGKLVARFDVKGTVDLDCEYLDYALQHWSRWEEPKTKSKKKRAEMFVKWLESYVLLQGISMLKNTCVGLQDDTSGRGV
jgi:hypothetical protein|tara:strand:+ start:915 stop:1172 length:258 start_codon:yes stop_codon:yes gene_type:complete